MSEILPEKLQRKAASFRRPLWDAARENHASKMLTLSRITASRCLRNPHGTLSVPRTRFFHELSLRHSDTPSAESRFSANSVVPLRVLFPISVAVSRKNPNDFHNFLNFRCLHFRKAAVNTTRPNKVCPRGSMCSSLGVLCATVHCATLPASSRPLRV